MDTRKIKKLIELVKETGIGELEVKSGEESVRISTTPPQTTPTPAPTTTPSEKPSTPAEKPIEKPKEEVLEGHEVKSPMVGTVYLSSKPGASPFVAVGQQVNVGDTLCLIEAMKMFNKIDADKAGVISARLVDNGQPVEYNQPLFIIDTGE